MSLVKCPRCHRLQPLVPHITEDEIGQVQQYLRDHRQGGREFAGPRCPGSRLPAEAAMRAAS